jgi:hypothetical protein
VGGFYYTYVGVGLSLPVKIEDFSKFVRKVYNYFQCLPLLFRAEIYKIENKILYMLVYLALREKSIKIVELPLCGK